jgi:nucleotide-binding universal stress UspA family protein
MVTWRHDPDAGIDEPDSNFWERSWDVVDSYKRILIAIDQNPWSYDTITHAVALAAQANATLVILMVPTYLIIQEAPYGMSLAETLADATTQESNAILAWAADAAERAAVPYTTIFRWGSAVPTILHVADEARCDLIVIGSPVKTGWLRFFQPSYAKYVAANARQPVLVVKSSS